MPAERAAVNRWPALGAEVVRRARMGESAALGEFFDHYFPCIFALVRRLVGDTTTAEDITQNVFVKIHRNLMRLDPSRDPAPWLYTIAVNACRDFWKSETWRMSRRSVPIDAPEVAARLHSSAAGPEQLLVQAEESRLLLEAIDLLPEPLRLTVVLHHCEGLDHREIAEITGVAYAASRKRHSRALQALADLLREGLSR